MTDGILIRESGVDDQAGLRALYPRMFPEEDLVPLVEELLRGASGVWSLVAEAETRLVGHVLFTRCGVEGGPAQAALLAPLGVAPEFQRQGIGSSLVRAGFRLLEEANVSRVFVLGDPAYYGRFGFSTETAVLPPYPLPAMWREAWQSRGLMDETEPPLQGVLDLPTPWMKPALWAP